MSNNVKNQELYARALGLNLEEFDELAKRAMGYLRDRPLNNATIKDMFFIFVDIQKRSEEKQAEKWKTVNDELRKHGADIAELRTLNKGYGKIREELKLKVSPTSIKNFCKDNNLEKGVAHV